MRRISLGLIGILLAGCSSHEVNLPPELLGRWVTDAEGYSDRAIQMTDGVLVLDIGDEALRVHRVTDVSSEVLGTQTSHILKYRNEDGVWDELRVFYESRAENETIRLKNLELIVWRKSEHRAAER